MICLAFHNPKKVLDTINSDVLTITAVFTDSDLSKVRDCVHEDNRNVKVLLARGIDRLMSYYDENHLRQFRIFIFDSPQQIWKHQLVLSDLKLRASGVHQFRAIHPVTLRWWVSEMRTGLAPDLFAHPDNDDSEREQISGASEDFDDEDEL